MMTSNYNVLTLPLIRDGKYKIGDVFRLSEQEKRVCDWRILKFDGLQIKNIDYCWRVRLHFDWREWQQNPMAERPKIEPGRNPFERNTY